MVESNNSNKFAPKTNLKKLSLGMVAGLLGLSVVASPTVAIAEGLTDSETTANQAEEPKLNIETSDANDTVYGEGVAPDEPEEPEETTKEPVATPEAYREAQGSEVENNNQEENVYRLFIDYPSSDETREFDKNEITREEFDKKVEQIKNKLIASGWVESSPSLNLDDVTYLYLSGEGKTLEEIEKDEDSEEPGEVVEDYKLHIFHYSEFVETREFEQLTEEEFDAALDAVIEAAIAEGWTHDPVVKDGNEYYLYLTKDESEEPVENPYYVLKIYQKGELTQTSEYGEIDYDTFWAGAQATIDALVESTGLAYVHLDVEAEEGSNRVIYSAYLEETEEPVELEDYKLHIYHYSELVETRDYDQVTLEDFEAAVAAATEDAIAEGWVEDVLVRDGNEYHLYLVKADSEAPVVEDYKLHIYHYSELVETKAFDQVTREDFEAAVAAVIEQAIAEGWVEDILVRDGNEYYLYLVKAETEESTDESEEESSKEESTKEKDKEETTKEKDKDKLPETGEANAYGIFGAAALAILAGVGLAAPSLKKED